LKVEKEVHARGARLKAETRTGVSVFLEMNVSAYLNRIGVRKEDATLDIAGLMRLQRRHLLRVPFENLDIHWKRPIVLDTDIFFRKIVETGRGGFCYELNGLFNELLQAVGFETRLVSARVSTGGGNFSNEYDHAAIIAVARDREYLTDVGFGAFTAEPLELLLDKEQEDTTGRYVIRRHGEGYLAVLKKDEEDWRAEYIFKPVGRDLAEFEEMCRFHQTSPESHFTRGKVCSMMTADGRKTLRDNRFIVTMGAEKTETDVGSETKFDDILEREFGIKRAEARA
jgi:N-hydroxyarylamine O-acetyltransferase